MGQIRWISVLATASAAASWLCTAGAWKLYRSHDLAVNGPFEASDSFLEAQWGQPYANVPGTKNPNGSVSFIFAQSVNGYVGGHEPPKTSEGSASSGNAGPTQGSGGVSTSPEEVGGSTGSTQDSASSGSVESVQSGGATGNDEVVEGSSSSPQGPTTSESEEAAPSGGASGSGAASTSPGNAGASSNEVVLRDFHLGSCRIEGMNGKGSSQYRVASNIATLQACHKLCLSEDRCNWYTYNTSSKNCYLKGDMGSMRPGAANDITSPKYCDSSCYLKNRKVVGTKISTDLAASAFICHYKCHVNSSCHSWTYNRLSTQCQLFSNAGTPGVQLMQDFVSGPRDGCGSEAKAGEESQLPGHVVNAPTQGATGSTQGTTSSGTVESAPVEDTGSTGGSTSSGSAGSSTEGASGSHQESPSSGDVVTRPAEPAAGSSGSTQGTTSSGSVESAPSGGATGSDEVVEGSSSSPQGPTTSGSEEAAPSGGATGSEAASTSPGNAGASPNEVVLQDFQLGSCRIEGLTGTGPSEFRVAPNIATLEACHKLCLNEDRCNWYTYNTKTKNCYLKGEMGPMRQGAAGDITSPKFCDSSCYRKNRRVVGTEVSSDYVDSAFVCHYQCHMTSGCHYWSYNWPTRQCQLFSDAGPPGVQLMQDFVSGPRGGCGSEAKAGEVSQLPEHVVNAPTQGATGSTHEPSSPENVGSSTGGAAGNGAGSTLPEPEEEEVELEEVELGPCRFNEMSVTGPGEYSIRGNIATIQDCHDICLREDRCNWYTYNTPNKRCYLKANAGPLKHVIPGDTTSPKYCDSSCYIQNKKLVGTLLESLTGRLMTAFTCHYECHMRSDCYYWSWDSKTLDCHLFSNTGFQGKKLAPGFVSGPRDGCGVEAKAGGVSAIP